MWRELNHHPKLFVSHGDGRRLQCQWPCHFRALTLRQLTSHASRRHEGYDFKQVAEDGWHARSLEHHRRHHAADRCVHWPCCSASTFALGEYPTLSVYCVSKLLSSNWAMRIERKSLFSPPSSTPDSLRYCT